MKHDCVSCGKPGGEPSNGGLCSGCQVFGRVRHLGIRPLAAMLRLMGRS